MKYLFDFDFIGRHNCTHCVAVHYDVLHDVYVLSDVISCGSYVAQPIKSYFSSLDDVFQFYSHLGYSINVHTI